MTVRPRSHLGELYLIPLEDGSYRVGRRGGRSALTGRFLITEELARVRRA